MFLIIYMNLIYIIYYWFSKTNLVWKIKIQWIQRIVLYTVVEFIINEFTIFKEFPDRFQTILVNSHFN